MTDKEKVLAKFPEAWMVMDEDKWWYVSCKDLGLLACGTTESEAWANAAKGLE